MVMGKDKKRIYHLRLYREEIEKILEDLPNDSEARDPIQRKVDEWIRRDVW